MEFNRRRFLAGGLAIAGLGLLKPGSAYADPRQIDFDGRILAASLCPYGIGAPGGVLGFPVAQDVGFTSAPISEYTAGRTICTELSLNVPIHACYVGETNDHVILAFRGTAVNTPETALQSLLDWFNNLLAKPIPANEVIASGVGGNVHVGFYDAVEQLLSRLPNPTSTPMGIVREGRNFAQEIKHRMDLSPHKKLVITGYSKGGALAPIAAMILTARLQYVEPKQIIIRLYEAPRPGDQAFAESFNASFNGLVEGDMRNIIRYEYQDDIIPYIPFDEATVDLLRSLEDPSINGLLDSIEGIDAWNYQPVGDIFADLKYINHDNEVVVGSLPVAFERLESLKKLLCVDAGKSRCEPNTGKLVEDHAPFGCGHIYDVLCKYDPTCPSVTLSTPKLY